MPRTSSKSKPPADTAILPHSARLLLERGQRRALQFTAGGRWTDRLQASVRQNLRWFWFDGVFAQASEAIVLSYLSLFVLALGASRAQIGLMSALSSLSGALLLLPGAAIVERWGRRKQIVVFSGGGAARVILLLSALVPLAFAGPTAIYPVIVLAVARNAIINLGVPAWMSLTADVVPLSWRGRYFSARNMAMGVVGMITTFFVGQLITYLNAPAGYQWAMGLAFAIGMGSTFSFAHIEEPVSSSQSQPSGRGSRLDFLRHLSTRPDFLTFCATAALWSFSLNVAGPFFNVYLVEDLRASAGIIGTLSVVSSLAALPGQRLFGTLNDRWGAHRVQLVTSLFIPLLPLAWALTRSPWHAVPLNLAGGFLWAGYGLSSFNFLLTFIPEDRRPRYSALYQIIVMAASASGAAVGGVLADAWGYRTVFVLSGIGRFGAALFFAWFVRRTTGR
jgi:MFS family permease